MRGRPGPEAPPEPVGGWLFVVRYVHANGQTISNLSMRRVRADRLIRDIRARGGSPTLHRVRIAGWTPVPTDFTDDQEETS